MAWIESHQQLRHHPKTHALMSLMEWNEYETIGRLHCFWWWCLDYAPTGDLRKFNDAVLAGSVGLDLKDGNRFVDAMVESCWIDRSDGTFRVHDWPEYAGRYLKESKFKNHPDRQQEVKDLYGNPVEKSGSEPPGKRPRTIHGPSKVPTNQPNQPTNIPPNPPDVGKGKRKKEAVLTPEQQAKRMEFSDWWTKEGWPATHYGEKYPFESADPKWILGMLRSSSVDWDVTKLKEVAAIYLAEPPSFGREGHKLDRLHYRLGHYCSEWAKKSGAKHAGATVGKDDYAIPQGRPAGARPRTAG
jgi:hypothetical protein